MFLFRGLLVLVVLQAQRELAHRDQADLRGRVAQRGLVLVEHQDLVGRQERVQREPQVLAAHQGHLVLVDPLVQVQAAPQAQVAHQAPQGQERQELLAHRDPLALAARLARLVLAT